MPDKDAFLSHGPHIAVDFIAQWEGFRSSAYKCPAGVWTIGVGHTQDVTEHDEIVIRKRAGVTKEELDGTRGASTKQEGK